LLSDLRLAELPLNSQREHTTHALEMELFLTPHGTARPEEVLTVLGLQDLVEAGAVLERSRLELHDEVTPTNQTEPPLAALQACKADIGKETPIAEGIA
jgi:hypothetical protein